MFKSIGNVIWLIVRVLLGGSLGIQFCKLCCAAWFLFFLYMYLSDPPYGIPALTDSYAVAHFRDSPSAPQSRDKRLYSTIDGVEYLTIVPRGKLSGVQRADLEGKTVHIKWMQVDGYQGSDQLLYVYFFEYSGHVFWNENDCADFIRDTKETKWKNFIFALLAWGLLCAHSVGQIRIEFKSRRLTNG